MNLPKSAFWIPNKPTFLKLVASNGNYFPDLISSNLSERATFQAAMASARFKAAAGTQRNDIINELFVFKNSFGLNYRKFVVGQPLSSYENRFTPPPKKK